LPHSEDLTATLCFLILN